MSCTGTGAQHPNPPRDDRLTRRTLLQAAVGGAGVLYAGSLPAWARVSSKSAGHLRRPDSLPFPHLPAGTASMPQIEHIVVLMMENHSFDNLLGMVPYQVPGRAGVDGLTVRNGKVTNSNPGATGGNVLAMHDASPCQLGGEPSQTWNASHTSYDNGRNDGFVRASGNIAMAYWDNHDIPFTYALAKHFPIGERYFCSALAQTYPNRRFFFCGTASGLTSTNLAQSFSLPAANGTIFDRLDGHGIDWANYYQQVPSVAIVPGAITVARATRFRNFDTFYADVAAGKLAQFTFLDPNYKTTSEANPQDIQVGEEFVGKVVHALIHASTWKHTALFITYDEHGGYYDHVPPPSAIAPDSIAPIQDPTQPPLLPGGFNRYGFRVPLIVVSPWARQNYVSSVVQDHTSLDAFIERKWNLPAMTYRDANAQPMTDYFDFTGKPAFAKPPALAAAPGLGPGLNACHAAGLNPPLPTTSLDG